MRKVRRYQNNRPEKSVIFGDFSGGYNDRDAILNLPINETPEAQNCFMTDRYIKKIKGAELVAELDIEQATKNIGHYYYNTGGTVVKSQYVAADDGTNTKTYKVVSDELVDQSQNLSRYSIPCFVNANNCLYVFTGQDDVRKLSGLTWSTLSSGLPMSGSNTRGAFAYWWKRMLFVAGVKSHPYTLYISKQGDPEDFSDNFTLLVDPHVGGKITGFQPLGDYLVVHKENSCYLISGDAPEVLSYYPYDYKVGAMNFRCVDTVADKQYFAADDGHIYEMSLNYKGAKRISDKMKGVIGSANLNAAETTAWLKYEPTEKKILYSIPTTELYNDTILVYDPLFDNCQPPIIGLTLACADVYASSDYEEMFVGEGGESVKLYKMFSGNTFNEEEINFQYTFAPFYGKDPFIVKNFKRVMLLCKSIGVYDLDIETRTDGQSWAPLGEFEMSSEGFILGEDGGKLGLSKLGGANIAQIQDTRIEIPLSSSVGRWVQLRLSDSQEGGQTEIYQISLEYYPRGMRRRK